MRAALGTVFYGFGTVAWYAAMLGFDMVPGARRRVGLTFLAIGVAVGADPESAGTSRTTSTPSMTVEAPPRGAGAMRRRQRAPRRAAHSWPGYCSGWPPGAPDGRVRGPVLRVRRPRRLLGRALVAGLGAAIPLLSWCLQRRTTGRSSILPMSTCTASRASATRARYHPEWGMEDLRYIPQNLGIALFGTPDLMPVGPAQTTAPHPTPVCVDPDERGLFKRVSAASRATPA